MDTLAALSPALSPALSHRPPPAPAAPRAIPPAAAAALTGRELEQLFLSRLKVRLLIDGDDLMVEWAVGGGQFTMRRRLAPLIDTLTVATIAAVRVDPANTHLSAWERALAAIRSGLGSLAAPTAPTAPTKARHHEQH